MTVANSSNKITYTGNGLTTQFPFTFKIFKATDIQVIVTDVATGTDTTISTNYSVDTSSSYVTYPVSGDPITSATKITISRAVPITQETSLPNQGPYFARIIENALDKATILSQQLQEKALRSLIHSVSADTDVSNELPAPVPYQLLMWDTTGKKITNTLPTDVLIPGLYDYGAIPKTADIITKGPWVDVRAFGAKGDGVTDDTSAIQNAIDYCIANKLKLVIPPKVFLIYSSLIVQNAWGLTIESMGATLRGSSLIYQEAVLSLINVVDFKLLGHLTIICASTINYGAGLVLKAIDGGLNACTRNSFHNLSFQSTQIGIKIGQYDIDRQNSENNFFGAEFFGCPIAVYIGGSQTGATFVGCNLVSEPNAAFDTAIYPSRVLWMEGGFATITGGEMCIAAYGGGACVKFEPCKSTLYGNCYPILRVTGTHIESASDLLVLNNPRSLATTYSKTSQFCILASGGYVSGGLINSNFIEIDDATYEGRIQLKACNFYATDSARNAYNIYSASNYTIIDTDKTSLGAGFRDWMGAVAGGILLHGEEKILAAYGLTAGTLSATANTLIFKNVRNSGKFARYFYWYNNTNGVFVIPVGGFKTLNINSQVLPAGLTTGDFYIKRGSTIVAFGQISNGIAQLNCDLFDLLEGEEIRVILHPTTTVTVDMETWNSLVMTAST